MLIKEIMDTNVDQCTEDTPLPEVYELIQQSAKDYVIVIDSNQHRVPIGFINEHTICENLIKRTRNTKGLYAASVMSSRIKRVCENQAVEEQSELAHSDFDALVVVNERRQFQGVLNPADLKTSIPKQINVPMPSVGGFLSSRAPSAVEIPAFGWLK